MEEQNIKEIDKRLDTIISILLNSTKIQEETTKEKIARLVTLGFENQEIANILNISLGFVAKERSLFKKVSRK